MHSSYVRLIAGVLPYTKSIMPALSVKKPRAALRFIRCNSSYRFSGIAKLMRLGLYLIRQTPFL